MRGATFQPLSLSSWSCSWSTLVSSMVPSRTPRSSSCTWERSASLILAARERVPSPSVCGSRKALDGLALSRPARGARLPRWKSAGERIWKISTEMTRSPPTGSSTLIMWIPSRSWNANQHARSGLGECVDRHEPYMSCSEGLGAADRRHHLVCLLDLDRYLLLELVLFAKELSLAR
jgi:hypothetical protein